MDFDDMDKLPILAIEDNAIQRRLLSLLAEKFELNFNVVDSCSSALDALKRESYALILLDWSLGDADGGQCARLIRQVDAQRGEYTPIIAVTGRVMAGDREECLSSGADDYLSKPFSLDQFRAVVNKWIGKKQSSADFVLHPDWHSTDVGRGGVL